MTGFEVIQNEINENERVGAKVLRQCDNEVDRGIIYGNFVGVISVYKQMLNNMTLEEAMMEA